MRVKKIIVEVVEKDGQILFKPRSEGSFLATYLTGKDFLTSKDLKVLELLGHELMLNK